MPPPTMTTSKHRLLVDASDDASRMPKYRPIWPYIRSYRFTVVIVNKFTIVVNIFATQTVNGYNQASCTYIEPRFD